MDKKILQDYIDACELIGETEKEISRISRKKKTVIQTNVKGSSHDFPYTPQHFKIQGTTFTVRDDDRLRHEEKLLEQRKARAEEIKIRVEEWMLTIPARIQRIIKYKYLDGLTWEQVAAKMGRNTTADGARKEIERFFEKN
ncbi:MAG: RNA polymerase subunit sigma-70 [bacterium]|nr:RNA polymerase subunit sigma-70 [bacterium]